MSHVFISYSRADADFVRYLKSLLEEAGLTVWVDEARLSASARWWKTIEQNIDMCGAFVVVMSPEAAESDWVEREILRAEAKKAPIYPVLYRGDPWSRLANIQYEDLRAGLRAQLSPHLVEGLRAHCGAATGGRITFQIMSGLLHETEADVVALPFYGTTHYGGAMQVAHLLEYERGIDAERMRPPLDQYSLIETGGIIKADRALFLGMPRLSEVGYHSIREFGRRALATLPEVAPDTGHLLMTIHGPGAGLDETEGLLSLFGGFLDALMAGVANPALKRLTIVERDRARSGRLRGAMEQYLDGADYAERLPGRTWAYAITPPLRPMSMWPCRPTRR